MLLFVYAGNKLFSSVEASETVNLEEKTKAAFIYHFTKYIKWPQSDSSATFNIGVLGESIITGPLEEVSDLKKVGTRRIVIHQLDSVQQCGPCHILFVANPEEERFEKIRAYLKGSNTLIVTDTKEFGRKGSCINFIASKGRLRFEINMESLKKMNLTVSSQLLKLAIIINGEDNDD